MKVLSSYLIMLVLVIVYAVHGSEEGAQASDTSYYMPPVKLKHDPTIDVFRATTPEGRSRETRPLALGADKPQRAIVLTKGENIARIQAEHDYQMEKLARLVDPTVIYPKETEGWRRASIVQAKQALASARTKYQQETGQEVQYKPQEPQTDARRVLSLVQQAEKSKEPLFDATKAAAQQAAFSVKGSLASPISKGIAIGAGATAAVLGATALGAGIASQVVKHTQAIKLDSSMFADDGVYAVDLVYRSVTIFGENHYAFKMSIKSADKSVSIAHIIDEDGKSLSLPQSGITVRDNQIDVKRGFLCLKNITVKQVSGGSSSGTTDKGGCGSYTFVLKKDGEKLMIDRQ